MTLAPGFHHLWPTPLGVHRLPGADDLLRRVQLPEWQGFVRFLVETWSGVYIVQADGDAERCAHLVYSAANGVTRFFGPPFTHLAGAFADLGNVYLQPPHLDVAPVPGQLVLFPSWLAHQAMPYVGTLDRVIVSFNASLHAAQGGNRLFGFSAT